MNTIPKLNSEQKPDPKRQLRIGTWNVRRGLIRRENEIKLLLQSEDLDIRISSKSTNKDLCQDPTYLINSNLL